MKQKTLSELIAEDCKKTIQEWGLEDEWKKYVYPKGSFKLKQERKIKMACTCGHSEEEHGHDPEYPGSTSCTETDCDCISFESDEENE